MCLYKLRFVTVNGLVVDLGQSIHFETADINTSFMIKWP